jgi:acetyltransferase-like isoleucine patch superfamily enzyme
MANKFHPTARISPLAVIEVSIRNTDTEIGADSVVDDFVKIKHVGGSGSIVIGERVYLNSFTVIYSGNGVRVGDDTAIGPNCSIVPVNHKYADKFMLIRLQRFAPSKGGVTIGRDVWIGAGVTILDGATIGDGAVIGAGALVTGKIEAYSICIGSPCKSIGYRS